MSTTARDIISGSLRLLGVLASSESASASEATDGLSSFNDMLDSWSNENLMIPNKVREVFPFVAGQKDYTMGTGGNFNTSRPIKIENALIQLTGVTPNLELPMHILNKDQYAEKAIKDLQSTYPMYVYPDGNFPLTTLSFWPVPTQTNNVVLYSQKPLANISSLSTALSLPPGYNEAIKYNLAVRLAPEYGKAIPDAVALLAMESKANIKRTNFVPSYLKADASVRATRGVFNWYTGDTT